MTFSKQLVHLLFFFFFFFFFFFPLLNALEPKRCKSSSCGNVAVHFPFWLSPKQSSSCGYPRFNLHCTNRHKTALKLPNSNKPFLIREIDYKMQRIHLNDPDNCLARRLLSFVASESPFSPIYLINYTFLICPQEHVKSSLYKPIHCLSNSTFSFFAFRFDLVMSSMPSSCQIFKTLLLPFYSPFADELNDQVLWLKWDSPNCRECDQGSPICGYINNTTLQVKCFDSGNPRLLVELKAICVIFTIVVMTSVFIVVTITNYPRIQQYLCLTRFIPRQAISGVIATSMDESTIVELGESKRLPSGSNDNICSICLSEYGTGETVRCLPKCEHCFHTQCIDAWLNIHNSCPLCRSLT